MTKGTEIQIRSNGKTSNYTVTGDIDYAANYSAASKQNGIVRQSIVTGKRNATKVVDTMIDGRTFVHGIDGGRKAECVVL